jgi:hypothetical protein
VRAADDLGMEIVWTGSPAGVYSAHWQIPRRAGPGAYRFKITANLYRLRSHRFAVDPGAADMKPDSTHPAAVFAPVTSR